MASTAGARAPKSPGAARVERRAESGGGGTDRGPKARKEKVSSAARGARSRWPSHLSAGAGSFTRLRIQKSMHIFIDIAIESRVWPATPRARHTTPPTDRRRPTTRPRAHHDHTTTMKYTSYVVHSWLPQPRGAASCGAAARRHSTIGACLIRTAAAAAPRAAARTYTQPPPTRSTQARHVHVTGRLPPAPLVLVSPGAGAARALPLPRRMLVWRVA